MVMKNDWMRHITLGPDLIHETRGIKVRACSGLRAVDYLTDNEILKRSTYVFGPLINFLKKSGGYEEGVDLDAAPYDWRIPPQELEARDHYFTNALSIIERMFHINGKKVVLLCHSLGCKVGHYLLKFAKHHRGQEWIDTFVETLFLAGNPTLGASVSLPRLVLGHRMGLPKSFLKSSDALVMARSFGSASWLLPNEVDGSANRSINDGNIFMVKRQSVLLVQPREFDFKGILHQLDANLAACTVGWTDEIKLKFQIEFAEEKYRSEWYSPAAFTNGEMMPLVREMPNLEDLRHEFVEFPAPRVLNKDNDTMVITVLAQGLSSLSNEIRRKPVRSIKACFGCVSASAFRTLDKAQNTLEFDNGRVLCIRSVHLGDILPKSPDDDKLMYFDRRKFQLVNATTKYSTLNSLHSMASMEETGREALVTGRPGTYHEVNLDLPVRKGIHRAALEGSGTLKLWISWVSDKDIRKSVVGAHPLSNSLRHSDYSLESTDELLKREELHRFMSLMGHYASDPFVSSDAPPISRVIAVYGVNQPTPLGTVFRRKLIVNSERRTQLIAQHKVDEEAKIPQNILDRRSLQINRGVIQETKQSVQTDPANGSCLRTSGDGTVSYSSLSYVKTWASCCDLTVHELEGMKHREMLNDSEFHHLVLESCQVKSHEAKSQASDPPTPPARHSVVEQETVLVET